MKVLHNHSNLVWLVGVREVRGCAMMYLAVRDSWRAFRLKTRVNRLCYRAWAMASRLVAQGREQQALRRVGLSLGLEEEGAVPIGVVPAPSILLLWLLVLVWEALVFAALMLVTELVLVKQAVRQGSV